MGLRCLKLNKSNMYNLYPNSIFQIISFVFQVKKKFKGYTLSRSILFYISHQAHQIKLENS